jgi:hypothetical protein
MAKEVRRLTAEIVIETDADDLARMTAWVVSRVKSSVDFSDHGAVAIIVRDEEGVIVGRSQIGEFTTISELQLRSLVGDFPAA